MNEATSIFMTMIESTLNKMIDARIEAKVFTLTERIDALEKAQDEGQPNVIKPTDITYNVMTRLDDMEIGLKDRITELEKAPAPSTQAAFDFESDEFRAAVIKIVNTHTMGDEFLNPLIDALIDCDTFNDKVKEISAGQVGSAIEDAISDHCCDFDHDDIHQLSDHETNEDAVTDIIKEVLNNVTVTLKI